MKKILLLLLGLFLGGVVVSAGEKKVLVYMFDGMRADKIPTTESQIWNQLQNNTWADSYRSQWSLDASNDPLMPPNSAPNHAAIATGRSGNSHKVMDNKYFNDYDADAAPVFLQILQKRLGIPVLFAFYWGPDKLLIPECPAVVLANSDSKNGARLVEILKKEDAPDALLVFDDTPDMGGHRTGFYPFGDGYNTLCNESVARFEAILTAIKNRPTFAKEDWLILICSDHGGNEKKHGVKGGQASTVPLLFCGKNLQPGQIYGRPDNLSIVPMVFRHFGLPDEAAKLPGNCDFRIVQATPANAAPRYDISVQDGKIVNAGNAKFTLHGDLPIAGDSFDLRKGGYITLDELRGRGEKPFTFAITLEFDPAQTVPQEDPVLFGNKDWKTGLNPGFVIFLKEQLVRANFKRDPALPTDFILDRAGRVDFYGFQSVAGKKTVIAGSVGKNGVITLFQKHPDQQNYWISFASDGVFCASDLDWNIGKDGTGKPSYRAPAKISRFRFWDEALSLDELRNL